MQYALMLLVIFSAVAQGHEVNQSLCSNKINDLIEVRKFSCLSKVDCELYVWVPATIEGKEFRWINVEFKSQNDSPWNLAVLLNEFDRDNGKVATVFGSVDVLKTAEFNVTYTSKKDRCSLSDSLSVKGYKEHYVVGR